MKLFGLLLTLALLGGGGGAGADTLSGPVLVFGGTSGTGLETVKVLRSRDVPVTVFVRPTSDLAALESLGVELAVGDALDPDAVKAAFATADFSAVVSSLGGRRGEPRPDYIGNKNITDAAKVAGVQRVIQVTAIGAGDANRAKPPADASFMRKIMYEKTRGEDYLIASGLDYTLIRPGGLRDGPPTGGGIMVEEPIAGSINRSDLGLVIVAALGDPATVGRAYNVIDKHKEGDVEEE